MTRQTAGATSSSFCCGGVGWRGAAFTTTTQTCLMMIGANPTPTTSPSSDGLAANNAAAIDHPLSPKDLTDNYEAVHTAQELSPPHHDPSLTTSTIPKHVFVSVSSPRQNNSTINQAVNHSNENNNKDLLESVMGLKSNQDKNTKFNLHRMMIGSMLAYVVLGIWIWTVFQFILSIQQDNCASVFSTLKPALRNPDSTNLDRADSTTAAKCLDLFTGTLACAHSITFGLVSAVVIHETGSSEDSAKDRLSSMIRPLMKRRDVNANFVQRSLCWLISSLPMVYVVSWTVFGLVCFVYSLTTPDGSSGPLFYTGQTWIGLVVKATYSFFGMEEPDDSTNTAVPANASQMSNGQQQQQVVQSQV